VTTAHGSRRAASGNGGGPAATTTFKQAITNTSGGSTSRTMTHNGGVRTGKWGVVLMSRQGAAGPADATGVTFCGTTLTKLEGITGTGQMSTSIWISTNDITTDGTDDVVATFSSSQTRTVSVLYALDNLQSTTAVDTAEVANTSPATLDVDVSAGGVVLAGMCCSGNATTSWSGLNEDVDQTDGSRTESAASGAFASASTPLAISATQNSSNAAAVAVSLR
jgi:hypothetical protein